MNGRTRLRFEGHYNCELRLEGAEPFANRSSDNALGDDSIPDDSESGSEQNERGGAFSSRSGGSPEAESDEVIAGNDAGAGDRGSNNTTSSGGAFQSRRKDDAQDRDGAVESAAPQPSSGNTGTRRSPIKLPGNLPGRQRDDVVNRVLINGENEVDENSTLWSCEWADSSGNPVSSFVLLVFRDQSAQVITENWAESLQWSVASDGSEADLILNHSPGAASFRDVIGEGEWSLKLSDVSNSEFDLAFAGAGNIDFNTFTQTNRIRCGLYDWEGNPVER